MSACARRRWGPGLAGESLGRAGSGLGDGAGGGSGERGSGREDAGVGDAVTRRVRGASERKERGEKGCRHVGRNSLCLPVTDPKNGFTRS